MYGYCIWYLLHPDHPLHAITHGFPAHIPVLTNIRTLYIARQMLDIYSRKPRPSLKIQGHARVTRTANVETAMYPLMPTDASEYNLQLPMIFPVSIVRLPGEHPSLVQPPVDTIKSSEYTVALAMCASPDPTQWSVVCYPGRTRI